MKSSTFVIVCAASVAVSLSTFAHALLLPLYMEDAGATEAWIGVVVGTLSLSLVFGRFASGWAIDHWGARGFLVLGALALGVSSPLVSRTDAVGVLIAIRLVQGLAMALFTNAAIGYVAYAVAAHERTRALSVWWMSWSSAVVVGPLLAGAAMSRWGYDVTFLATGAVSLAAAVPCLFVPARGLRDTAGAASPRASLLPRPALVPGLVGAAVSFAAGAFFTFAPLHARALGMENPGLYMAVAGVGMLVGQLVLGRVSDARGRARAIVPAFGLALACALAIGAAHGPGLALPAAFFMGFSTSGLSPVLTAWAVDRAQPRVRSSAASASVAFREIGAFAGATALGAVLGAAGQAWAFAVVAAVLGAGMVGAGAAFTRRAGAAEEVAAA